MSKDPAFLFYPGDWMGGTVTFSRLHKGAYIDLLMAQYNIGHMSIEDIKIILGADYETMWESKLKSKFIQDANGLFYNKKLEEVIEKRKAFSESRRKNLKSKSPHMDDLMEAHVENENENEDIIKDGDAKIKGEYEGEKLPPRTSMYSEIFETFWDSYCKVTRQISDKEPAYREWKVLNQEERNKAMENIRNYYEDCLRNKRPAKMAKTYLRDRTFNNDFRQSSGFLPNGKRSFAV